MRLSELLEDVEPRWQEDFVRFVDSGEASEEFLLHLDKDEGLQQKVEVAFAAQATALQEFAQWVKSEELPPPAARASQRSRDDQVKREHAVAGAPSPQSASLLERVGAGLGSGLMYLVNVTDRRRARDGEFRRHETVVGDDVLAERVRSAVDRIGGDRAHVTVSVRGGHVTIGGEVAPDAIKPILDKVATTQGVAEVHNQLRQAHTRRAEEAAH